MVRIVAAIVLCLLLPAASRLLGDGRFAWTMFSRSFHYRLVIHSIDAGGRTRAISPTELGARAGGAASEWLIGAERLRRGGGGRVVRAHLDQIAAFACREFPSRRIELTLFHMEDADAPLRTTEVKRDCAR